MKTRFDIINEISNQQRILERRAGRADVYSQEYDLAAAEFGLALSRAAELAKFLPWIATHMTGGSIQVASFVFETKTKTKTEKVEQFGNCIEHARQMVANRYPHRTISEGRLADRFLKEQEIEASHFEVFLAEATLRGESPDEAADSLFHEASPA
jgi:hypothetical protein